MGMENKPNFLLRLYYGIEDRYYDLMEWLQAHHIPAVKVFVEPIEKHGIPSLPFTILFFLLLALAAGFVAVNGIPFNTSSLCSFLKCNSATQQPSSHGSFQVKVFQGANALEGATVIVYDGSNELASGVTGSEGSVSFDSLPARTLSFKAFKEGLGAVVKKFDTSKDSTLILSFSILQHYSGSTTIAVMDALTGFPLSGAQVFYSVPGKPTGSLSTDSNGKTGLRVEAGVKAVISISLQGYATNTLTFIAGSSDVIVKLYPSSSLPPEFTPPPNNPGRNFTSETGNVVVTIHDVQGNAVQNGSVQLFDDSSGALIASSDIRGGNAQFKEVSKGQGVYITVFSEGYSPYDSSSVPGGKQVVSDVTSFDVILQQLDSNSSNTTIQCVDESSNPTNCNLYLYYYPASLLSSFPIQGTLSIPLAPGDAYYVLATADSKLPSRSSLFTSGQEVSLVLRQANPGNSGMLNVTVRDDEGTSLLGAGVELFNNQGYAAYPGVITDENGVASIGPIDAGPYTLTAYSNGKSVTQNIQVRIGVNNVDLVVVLNAALLNLTAFDASTLQKIKAKFTTYDSQGNKLGECAPSPCPIQVPPSKVRLFAKEEGYADYQTTLFPLRAEQLSVQAFMIPSNSQQQVFANFVSITDLNNNPVQSLDAGGEYIVTLSISAIQADETGIQLRVGDQGSEASEQAGLIAATEQDSLQVFKSTSFRVSGPECSDLQFVSSPDGLYKWMQLSYQGNASREVSFLLKVKDTASPSTPITLNYRAYARRGLVYYRDPADPELGSSNSSDTKADCYSDSTPLSFQINRIIQNTTTTTSSTSTSTTSSTTTTLPSQYCGDNVCSEGEDSCSCPSDCPGQCVEKSFTDSANISFDENTGKFSSNVPEIDLQIDSVFPGDAIPLNFNMSQQCRNGLQVTIHTSQGTGSCYGFDNINNKLYFKGNELNPSCPLSVQGNSIPGDSGASLTLTMLPSCNPTNSLTIPVKVIAKDAPSFNFIPKGLSGDSAAKLIYLINEKQVGQRVISALSTNTHAATTFDLTASKAKAIAWRGPGTLTFTEGSNAAQIGEVSYSQAASYFPGETDLGHQASQCSDYLCCAGNWCTPNAFLQQFSMFKQAAASVANSTAFRRGNGQPFNYLAPGQNFEYRTVSQLIEGASPKLISEIQVQDAPGQCTQGNPGVYEVLASSPNGNNWSYNARTMNLHEYDYVAPACNAGYTALENATQPDTAFIPLCDFLYGEKECIKTAKNSNTASNEQSKHPQPRIIPSLFIPLKGGAFLCQALSAKYVTAYTTTSSVLSALIPPNPGCVSAITAVQTAYTAYQICLIAPNPTPPTPGITPYTTCADPVTAAIASATVACPKEFTKNLDTAFKAEFIAGKACDLTTDVYYDVPGIIPPRSSRMQCYAYMDSCEVSCTPRPSMLVALPYNNQYYCFLHTGINGKCLPGIPSLSTLAQTALCVSPNILGNMGQYLHTAFMLNGLVGAFKNLNNPQGSVGSLASVLNPPLRSKAISKLCEFVLDPGECGLGSKGSFNSFTGLDFGVGDVVACASGGEVSCYSITNGIQIS